MNWELDTHQGRPYRFLLPQGYDPAHTRYPLVVYLHGSRERGDDTRAHLSNGVDALGKWPVIAVAPQCPAGDTWGGSWYGGESATQRWLVSLVRELAKRRSVDPQRISLIGYSMGAIGLWDILERHQDLFAAAVPIAGDLNPESARSLVGFPIWAFHGERDKLVRPEATRRVAALMKELGQAFPADGGAAEGKGKHGAFRYTELKGVGHDSWGAPFENPDLMPWLLAQRR